MRFFYSSNICINTKIIFLEKEETSHITKVLRLTIGAEILVTNGKGLAFHCQIQDLSKNKTVLNVLNTQQHSITTPPITIAISPTKNIQRFEFFVEKAVEIGIEAIQPLFTSRTERLSINSQRIEKKMIEALKQSKQYYLPVLKTGCKLPELQTADFQHLWLAHCQEDTTILDLKNCSIPKINEKTLLLIGPEGDFTSKEIQLLYKKKFVGCRLGNNRLRTETSGLYALIILAQKYHYAQNI